MAKKDFFIPQIDEENVDKKQEKQKKYQPEGFVSSIYGKNVVKEAIEKERAVS